MVSFIYFMGVFIPYIFWLKPSYLLLLHIVLSLFLYIIFVKMFFTIFCLLSLSFSSYICLSVYLNLLKNSISINYIYFIISIETLLITFSRLTIERKLNQWIDSFQIVFLFLFLKSQIRIDLAVPFTLHSWPLWLCSSSKK